MKRTQLLLCGDEQFSPFFHRTTTPKGLPLGQSWLEVGRIVCSQKRCIYSLAAYWQIALRQQKEKTIFWGTDRNGKETVEQVWFISC